MSEREFKVWQTFIRREWNKPDRHDWYLMQIAALVDTFLSQGHVPTSEKKIAFEVTEEKETGDADDMSEEEIARWAEQQSNIRLAQLQAQSARSKSPGDQIQETA